MKVKRKDGRWKMEDGRWKPIEALCYYSSSLELILEGGT